MNFFKVQGQKRIFQSLGTKNETHIWFRDENNIFANFLFLSLSLSLKDFQA